MPWNRDNARLGIVLELTMATFCSDVTPTVVFNHFDDFADFLTYKKFFVYMIFEP